MAQARIPVDLLNPGQVFACLGLLEAAEVLCGDADGGFDWSNPAAAHFILRATGENNPVQTVLEFLASAVPKRIAAEGYSDPPPKKHSNTQDEVGADEIMPSRLDPPEIMDTFPAPKSEGMTLPIHIGGGNRPVVELNHWADGSGRDTFKLYAGNRSAFHIASAMLGGNGSKHSSYGIRQLWKANPQLLIKQPFDVLTAMGGSFNFDPRGAWTAIDTGYSPNSQGHAVEASPVLEFLAAWGLTNSRPMQIADRLYGYSAWETMLPLVLARPAIARTLDVFPLRCFRFRLALSGKNKVITFAIEDKQ
jgi:CRISPR-associated protein Csx14